MARGVLAIALLVCAAGDATAQGAADKASAEALFNEARKLMAEGKYADACPKFASSQRLDPGVGTSLNLGDCYEKTGKTASAWAQFREAAALASASGDSRRADVAQRRAAALEDRLCKLTVIRPSKLVPGLKVTRGEEPIDPAMLGTPLPVDPGTFAIEATAPGKKTWRGTVELRSDGATAAVEIPVLEDESPTSAQPSASTRASGSLAPTQKDAAGRRTSRRTMALVAGGVGVAGLAVGTVLGLSARSTWSDAQNKCPGNVCESDQDAQLGKDAQTRATWATVGFAIGAAGLVTGAVLWITAPKASSPTTSTGMQLTPLGGPSTAGLMLTGGF